MCSTLLVVVLALQSLTLIVLAALVVIYVRRLNDAAAGLCRAAEQIRDRLLPLSEDLRQAVKDADQLINSARTGVESIGRLSVSVEKLVEVSNVFQAAEKAMASSKTTIALVIEGIKAGLKALRTAKPESEEVTQDG